MNQVVMIIAAAAGLAVCLTAFFAILNIFFPRRIERTRRMAEELPGRSFAIGLVNCIFFAILLAVFMALGRGLRGDAMGLLGLIVLIPFAIGAIFGVAGLVELVGARLAAQEGGLKRTAWGAAGLELACALPFVGWFGLAPFVLVLGVGAFITGLFYREPKAVEDVEALPVPEV
ncbi:MAG: hypothetical protein AB1894_21890 [Chloroflexota bacterium]